jgi:hypothetical protein
MSLDRRRSEPVRPARRPLWIVALLLGAAAAALWGSGRTESGADGARWQVPLALLALAGIAGTVAVGGWPRRVLGIVLGSIGIGACALSAGTGLALGVLAGALLIVAGLVTVVYGMRMPRLGAAYQTPGARRGADDSDRQMWQALSEGKDPTTDDR